MLQVPGRICIQQSTNIHHTSSYIHHTHHTQPGTQRASGMVGVPVNPSCGQKRKGPHTHTTPFALYTQILLGICRTWQRLSRSWVLHPWMAKASALGTRTAFDNIYIYLIYIQYIYIYIHHIGVTILEEEFHYSSIFRNFSFGRLR